MRGRKLKLARRKDGRKAQRRPSSSFRIIRPDTGFTAHDMSKEVRALSSQSRVLDAAHARRLVIHTNQHAAC